MHLRNIASLTEYYCSKHNEKKRDESNSRQIGMTSITFLATIFCGKQQCSRESRRDEWRGYGRSNWEVSAYLKAKQIQKWSISFDICEERSECLFYLQNEMRRAGITQKDIDKARKSQEVNLIEHCKELRFVSLSFWSNWTWKKIMKYLQSNQFQSSDLLEILLWRFNYQFL